MTDHPTPFDPAAFLSECARVHEAGARALEELVLANNTMPQYRYNALRADSDDATNLRARTYGALLDVARGIVEERDEADRQLHGLARSTTEWFRVKSHRDMMDRFLSRLAAAGGGR